MYRLVAPLAVSKIADYCGKKVAQQQPTPQESIRAYHATKKLVAIGAIVSAILYGLYETHQHSSAFDSGTGAYGLLKLDARATMKQISQGYRRRSLSCHPDKNPHASAEYELVNKAYDLLKTPAQKFIYDRFGSEGLDQYSKFGEEGYTTICTNYVFRSLSFWVLSILSTLVNIFLGTNGVMLQLLVMAALGSLEMVLISREWYGWYVPLPIFQCIQLIRISLPVLLGSIPLLVPSTGSPLQTEVGMLNQTITQSKILADKRLDFITEPFKGDEFTMKRFRNAANAALQ